ncbi:hypothetical protein [Brucella intermedia]|uniref:hypothetical protein n=1 Tax=Brucella intermedia TaxID=94625 RepID=UPI001590E753|nr:hypothetical protein [Brucella intermedia]
MKLTDEDRKFLSSLNWDGSSTLSSKLPLATREQDKARKRAKKNGWAQFDRVPWAWQLQDEGRKVLKGGGE